MNKKAALELSVNTIVIVVLAMTLLGLGLGFIRSQMKNISDTGTVVVSQIRQQILDDLRRSDKKLSMPQNEFDLNSQSSETIAFGIKNMNDRNLKFKIKLFDLNDNANTCAGANGEHTTTNKGSTKDECAAFQWDSSEQTLEAGEANVYSFKIFAPKIKSSYMYKLVIWNTDNNEEYTSKTFFVTTK